MIGTMLRLANQAISLALQSREAIQQNRPGWVGLSVRTMGDSPNVAFAKITDPAGNVLFVSKGEPESAALEPTEVAQIPLLKKDQVKVFTVEKEHWESAAPIYTGGNLRGFVWVENNPEGVNEIRGIVERITVLFAVIWILASAMLVLFISGAITQPLAVLHRGTQALMNSPENQRHFPLAGDRGERVWRPD